jgi:hypothetical protein
MRVRRQIGIAAALALLLAAPLEAQIRVGDALVFQWTYTQAQIDSGQVAKFQVQIDTGEWVDSGLTVLPPRTYDYELPAQSAGDHVVRARACNANECGAALVVPYSIWSAIPEAPGGGKVVPKTTVVSIEQSRHLADAFRYALTLTRFDEPEFLKLATEYVSGEWPLPPTRGSVLTFLETVWLFQ